MIQILEKNTTSEAEYLEKEIKSEKRHQYIQGEIIEMTGGTPNHNQIIVNFASILNMALKRKPLQIFASDQRLFIPEKQIYTYPDIMITNQPLEYAENRKDTLINPLMIAEVLSNSTKNYDKDEKFEAYRTITTLKEYILIDQYKIKIEHYIKLAAEKWTYIEYKKIGDQIIINSINQAIEIADIYDKVEFTN